MKKLYFKISIAVFLIFSFLLSFSVLRPDNYSKIQTLNKATAAFAEKTISGTENWQLGSTENMDLANDLKPMIAERNLGKQEIPITHYTTQATTEVSSKDNPITGGSWVVTATLIQNPYPDYTFREEYWTVDLSEEQDYEYISFNLATDWAYHDASMLMISSDGSNWTYFHNNGVCEDGSTYSTTADMVNSCPVGIVYNYSNIPGAKYARIYMYDTTDVHSEYPTNHEERRFSVSNFKIYKDGATATHTSAANQLDGGDNLKNWTTFVPTDTIPANTTVKYRFKTSEDSSTWGNWTGYSASAASIDIESLLGATDSKKRYLQVETELKNTDGISTPTIDAYTANYETGVLDHVDVTATPESVITSQTSALSAKAISDIPKEMTQATFTWSTTCGAITSTGNSTATFTAPTNISAPFPNVCTVSATTTIDGVTKTGTKNITVNPCYAIIDPPLDYIYHHWGYSTHYSALAVVNPLVWQSIPGVTFNFSTDHGSIDNNGNYVAPSEDWNDPGDPNSHSIATINLSTSCGGTASTQVFLGAAPETCGDGTQNGDETGPDCGGSCSACPNSPPTCIDGIKNGIESDVDCGGICQACDYNPPATCGDGVRNGSETGIDCGGSCAACPGTTPIPPPATPPEPCTGDSCVPCEGSTCKPDVCVGDDCECLGDSCACTGPECSCTNADSCQTCVGDNCDPEPCTGDSCIPCVGSNCKPDVCVGDDCECLGDSCACIGPECSCTNADSCQTCVGDNCDPEPCTGDSCVPCEGSSCKPDVCVGDDCECLGDSCACTGPECNCTDPDKCKTCIGANCDPCTGEACVPCTSIWCKLTGSTPDKNPAKNAASILLALAGIFTLLPALLGNLLSLLTTTPAAPLFSLFLKGKNKKHQPGIIYDSMSGTAVPLAQLLLYRTRDHKLISTVTSDFNGRFALETPLGEEYYVETKKEGFSKFDQNNDLLAKNSLSYDNNYFGGNFRPGEGGSLFDMSIPITPNKGSLTFVKSALSTGSLIKILHLVNIPVLIVGLLFSIYVTSLSTSYFNYTIVIIYIIVLVSIFCKSIMTTRTTGVVTNRETGESISLAVIRVVSQTTGKLVKTVVTDSKGRYLLALPKGYYRVNITKPGLVADKIVLRVTTGLKPSTKNIKMSDIKPTQTDDAAVTNSGFANVEGRNFNGAEEIIRNFEQKRQQFGTANISDAGVHHLIDSTDNSARPKPQSLKIPHDDEIRSSTNPNWQIPNNRSVL